MKIHIKQGAVKANLDRNIQPKWGLPNETTFYLTTVGKMEGEWWRVDTKTVFESSFNAAGPTGPVSINIKEVDGIFFEELRNLEGFKNRLKQQHPDRMIDCSEIESIVSAQRIALPTYYDVTRASYGNVNNLILVTNNTRHLRDHLLELYAMYRKIKQPISVVRMKILMDIAVEYLQATLYDKSLTGEDLADYQEKTTFTWQQRDEYVRILIEDFQPWNAQQDYEATLNH